MPATEQTWRNTRSLHVVFGVSSLVMLVSTVWMLDADHRRSWKKHQREFRDIESASITWRIDEQATTDFVAKTNEIEDALAAARASRPPSALIAQFRAEVQRDAERRSTEPDLDDLDAASEALAALPADADEAEITERRKDLLAAMRDIVKDAKSREDNRSREMKFRKGEFDQANSTYGIAVSENASAEELARIEQEVRTVEADVQQRTLLYQATNQHRQNLERILSEIIAEETAALKAQEEHLADLVLLNKTFYERSANLQKSLLELPILDAFMGPIKPDQIWLPRLTIYNNFEDVARFDRCTTCHQAIDKTQPGSAVEPGFLDERRITVQLPTPAAIPELTQEELDLGVEFDIAEDDLLLRKAYGLQLAKQGLLKAGDVTVSTVWPETTAALAPLRPGDVIERINDVTILNRAMAIRYLLESVPWGEPLTLEIRRGLPHPYASHPRLDLFVGSMSPHQKMEMGCTICHDGQGSATDFKWASHMPNSLAQQADWREEYDWFNNHHWIFPMAPQRFVESNCLKCHHEVVDLEPSKRFPEPPAPKLVAGYHLIREYGCFGCHEINGYDSPDERIGPDLRAEPNYFAAAQQVLVKPDVSDEARELARRVVENPHEVDTRKRLAELITPVETTARPDRAAVEMKDLAGILGADDPTPGAFRKSGPSLRYVASKLDEQFLLDWIREPKHFRPSTKMPQFFGLNDHLLPVPKTDEDGNIVMETTTDADGHEIQTPVMEPSPGLLDSERFEPVEIRAATHYLLGASQAFEYLEAPAGVTEAASAERGKKLFQTQGCLACHQHQDFPEITATQGPELSRLGAKLTGDRGFQWLTSWLRDPTRYHARTVMPNVFLEPVADAAGKVSDQAADVAAYLLSFDDWQPGETPPLVEKDLDDLALLYLKGTFADSVARKFLEQGIPESYAPGLKGDEIVLVGEMSLDKKLEYVGRRTIGQRGCAGCHDIPGFENAKPIGATLADWGRKETSKLAFEQVVQYLERVQIGDDPHGVGMHEPGAHDGAHHGVDLDELDPDVAFFTEKLMHHEREGFLWQKLREPRSYDYKKTENKTYIERLRMPKFNFDQQQIEEIMTFVLGLVAEPPTAEYVYQPDGRDQAIVEGRKVLEKFNCGGCHELDKERWEFEYDAEWFAENNFSPEFTDYPFLKPHFSREELAESAEIDRRGFGKALVTGMPVVDDQGELVEGEDGEGNPVYYFSLWEPAAVNGESWLVAGPDLLVPTNRVTNVYPPRGGDLARYLRPIVLEEERATNNPNVKSSDAWGWLPPPLAGEGAKVQTDWLHAFLLNPYPIRPTVVLRMPKFNMSPDDASKLVNYFAAMDDAEFPYQFDPRTETSHLLAEEIKHPGRLEDALKIVTDSQNYCVKCHLLGDYTPPGDPKALAPNLDQAYERLRPDFLLRWLANPTRVLPYTVMPVNFPPDKAAAQDLYEGTSREQLDAVVDLLLNYDSYMNQQTSIKPMVKSPPPAAAGQSGAE